ncbi:YdgA family protein [Xenorhabdus lircayensis]|uniref:YdgA family protein n=1 Tax=Xenorhabdus lircayensis TaxID=2763499 RepID=A0ABS0U9I0_9GAMM|nr:YdgA family protein [Xenorhabdus lircayensis]MBI6550540.1 YdgA family protein [Xenorhabdus lircayensis]
MKKSLVAVSVVAALGVVWTGASWYTGKQIEGRLDQFINKANTELTKAFPESGIEWQAKDFKRGIFSSDVRLILNIKGGVKNAGIQPNEEIIFKSTIDHGPFPITGLKTFSLTPKMASIHSELEQSDALKELFNITQGKSLFSLDAKISYNGDLSSSIDLIPINHTETKENGDKRVLSFSGAKIMADTNRDLSAFSFTAKSDELSFSDPTKNESIILKGIDFTGNNKKGNFDIYIGDQSYSINEITMHGVMEPNEPNVSLKGLKITSNLGEDTENLNIKVGYSVDGIKIKDMELGSGQLMLGMEKLDGQSVRKFTQAYNDAAAEALATDKLSSDMTSHAIINNLHLLLNKNPQFSLAPFSWKNSKGESSIDFKLSLQNIPEQKETLIFMGPEEMIRTQIQELSLRVNVPKAMLIESITQAEVLDGKDKAAAETEAEQKVQMIAQKGIESKILTDENGVIGLNLHYANDKVKLNNKESNLHQFLLDNGFIGPYDDTDGERNQHDEETKLPVVE